MSHIDGISLNGFSEALTIAELRRSRYSTIPRTPGVYLIIRTSDIAPRFLPKSTGGRFKGKDPNYSMDVMNANWIEGAHIVYVGMTRAKKGLKGRLCQFLDFGSGIPVGHRGGRLLWHLEDSENLQVLWRACAAAEAYGAETSAIANFKAVHDGRRPYANMAK